MIVELLATLRLEILNIGIREHGQEWSYDQVHSPFSRLYLILDGEAETRHHGQLFQMRPGTLNLVPCFTTASYRCPNRFHYYYIHFTSQLAGGIDLFNLAKVEMQVEAGAAHLELFARLLALLPDRDIPVCRPHAPDQRTLPARPVPPPGHPGTWLESDGLFRQILAPVVATAQETSPMPEGFTRMLEFINANMDRPLAVSELAAHCGLHPNYFSGQFKKTFGISPCDYLNRCRVERAQTMMFAGGHSMKEIAASLGFADPAYFARLFKRYAGISPSDYQRRVVRT